MATVARADTAANQVKAGEDAAKQGRLTEAIERFKAADKIEKRAKHACLIALAYIRRELLPQAEVFLAVCNQRANATDPVPDWVPLAKQQLDDRLAKAKVAAVKIRVEPSGAAAMIAVSSWEPDELFSPQTIHLPRGKHLITATVPGKPPAQQTVEIVDNQEREVVLDFDRKPEPPVQAPPNVVRQQAPPSKPTQRVPNVVIGAGGALTVAAIAYHVLAFKPARDDLAGAADGPSYDALESRFDSRRTTTIFLYSAGAAVIATGLVLRYTIYKDRERMPMASLAVSPTGAIATMEWRR